MGCTAVMNKYNKLLIHISEEYGINKGKNEERNQWKTRVIYSMLGRMAMASLFDVDEEDTSSVVHMKRRIETLLTSYREMYPELNRLLPNEPTELSQEICDVFLHTGVIYHEPHRVLMAAKSEISFGGICFTRGYELETEQKLSGLGTYKEVDKTTTTGTLTDMFLLETSSLMEVWDYYTQRTVWSEFKTDSNVEYLRMAPPFSKGYWVDKPEVSGKVSLLRTGFKGSQLYYLYKVISGTTLVSQLPQWQVEDYNYRLLANACLCNEGVLRASTYKYDDKLVYLNFGYLPPPAELYLWKLYSWPLTMVSLPKDFNRICERKVFNVIKSEMQAKGYTFIEE